MTHKIETTEAPEARTEWAADDGTFVFRLFEEPGAEPIVLRLGYADCNWVLGACDSARRKRDYDRLLSRGAVAESGGRLLFVRVTADTDGRVGFTIEAPFGIWGWSLMFDGLDAASIRAAVVDAMKQDDAKA